MRTAARSILTITVLIASAAALAAGFDGSHAVRALGSVLAVDLDGAAVPCPAETAERLGGTMADYACIQVAASPIEVEQHISHRFDGHGRWMGPWSTVLGGRLIDRPYVTATGHAFVFYLAALDDGDATAVFLRHVEADAVATNGL